MTERTSPKASTVPDRFAGIVRDYTPEQVAQLRPTIQNDFVIARHGAERLWHAMHTSQHVAALGAMNGSQATNYVKGGMQALYLSGWQVAADANLAGDVYPDQSLYPSNSAPALVKKLNSALARASQIQKQEGGEIDYFVPIVADGEAGFGGAPHAYELMKAMIEAGAAGVHFEDQLASEKKCGHMGGKVLVPTSQFIRTLQAARLAADVLDVPTVLIARTDSLDATLLTSDIDDRDKPFITGERTDEGFFRVKGGLDSAIARGLSYAPYVDALWFETSKPDLEQARKFAEAIHAKFPGKLLSYNCSPSFNWKAHLTDEQIALVHEGPGRPGLQVPVRHAGRLARHQYERFRAGQGLLGRRHGGVLASAAAGIRRCGCWLHSGQAPARSRRRLLRCAGNDCERRQVVDHGALRLDRRRAVPALISDIRCSAGAPVVAARITPRMPCSNLLGINLRHWCTRINENETAYQAVIGGLLVVLIRRGKYRDTTTHPSHDEWNFQMSNMRLNNAVEEALGQGDGFGSDCGSSTGGSAGVGFSRTTHGAASGEGTRLSALRINHAEDEQYGMRHHEG